METSVNPQLHSRLLTLPAEIRHAIFAHFIPSRVHLSLDQCGSRLSLCVQRDRDGDPDCLARRTNTDNLLTNSRASDPTYLLRLRSSWGSHWRCEELVTQVQANCAWRSDNFGMPLLLVCKTMAIEIAYMVADVAVFQMHDLKTLEILALNFKLGSMKLHSTFTSTLFGCILPNVKELSVDLRLPVEKYEALENAVQSTLSEPLLIVGWSGLPLILGKMSKLRKLDISLDHDRPCSWSVVNERAILSPLVSVIANLNLDIHIHLPKLHPKWENPARHFIEDNSASPVAIHRRYRLRYHAIKSSDGSLLEKRAPDFPITHEYIAWDMTMEQIETNERRAWKAGEDPFQDLWDITQFSQSSGQGLV